MTIAEQTRWEIRHEARLDQLRELRELVAAGIKLTDDVLVELIGEVERATTPVADIPTQGGTP